jgi:hypothetical protein
VKVKLDGAFESKSSTTPIVLQNGSVENQKLVSNAKARAGTVKIKQEEAPRT